MAEFLTGKCVQGLRAEGGRIEVRDAKVPGLVLRVTPGVSKSWSVQYRPQGRAGTQRLTLGKYPILTIAGARAKARDTLLMLADGRDPIAERKAGQVVQTRRAVTFEGLFEEYVARRRKLASIREIERGVRKDVLPVLGGRHPAEITAADIDKIAQSIINERDSRVMARSVVVILKTMYNYVLFDAPALALRYGITSNPAERLGRRRMGSSGGLSPSAPVSARSATMKSLNGRARSMRAICRRCVGRRSSLSSSRPSAPAKFASAGLRAAASTARNRTGCYWSRTPRRGGAVWCRSHLQPLRCSARPSRSARAGGISSRTSVGQVSRSAQPCSRAPRPRYFATTFRISRLPLFTISGGPRPRACDE